MEMPITLPADNRAKPPGEIYFAQRGENYFAVDKRLAVAFGSFDRPGQLILPH